MQKEETKRVVAVAASDIHLSHRPPIARSVEQDWYAVQDEYMGQLFALAERDGLPVVIAGDVFDKHSPPVELVNFALRVFQRAPNKVYAVPGQHDLPGHRYENRSKSAYGTLVEAGRIVDLLPGKSCEVRGGCPMRLWGYPWGTDGSPCPDPYSMYLDVAVVHQYVFTKTTGYSGAPEEARLAAHKKRFKHYDAILFGDNHVTVTSNLDRRDDMLPAVFNPGGFIRRKRDEINHRPCAGLIYSDGSVVPHFLDVSKDQFVEAGDLDVLLDGIGGNSFVEALLELGDAGISFADAVRRVLEREKVSDGVKDFVRRAMGEA